MRADSIDLEIDGRPVRVIIEDETAREVAREVWADVVVNRPAPIGFVLKRPTASTKLHLVLDRSGFVLGRTRSAYQSVDLVGRHLVGLNGPAGGSVRFRMRALLSRPAGCVLAAFPLFTEPAPIERRLHREGFNIVDRMHVDLLHGQYGELMVSPRVLEATGQGHSCLGHTDLPETPAPVSALLMAADHPPSRAEAVFACASAAVQGQNVSEVIRCAESLAALDVRVVDGHDRRARYQALHSR